MRLVYDWCARKERDSCDVKSLMCVAVCYRSCANRETTCRVQKIVTQPRQGVSDVAVLVASQNESKEETDP